MIKTISGNVYDENGNVIGTVTGKYIDEAQDHIKEQKTTRQISITVVADGETIGSGSLTYEDYITYNDGGRREINISGNVTSDPDVIGTASVKLDDEYGEVFSIEWCYNIVKMQIMTEIAKIFRRGARLEPEKGIRTLITCKIYEVLRISMSKR